MGQQRPDVAMTFVAALILIHICGAYATLFSGVIASVLVLTFRHPLISEAQRPAGRSLQPNNRGDARTRSHLAR